MYSIHYNGLAGFHGTTGLEWYQKLSASNPKVRTLTPWSSPKSYGDFFEAGWQLQSNIRYVTPSYDTLDYVEKAIDGIRKYNEQALLWANQMPGKYAAYKDTGLLFVSDTLGRAHEKCQGLLNSALYNSTEIYGLPRLPWSSYVQFLGWTIHTIIKTYNLCKRYANAFKTTVKTGVLDPNLKTLPDLAIASTAAALATQVENMDKDPDALDLLQDLGVLPASPIAAAAGIPGALPPTMPNLNDEGGGGSGVKWYWWAAALGVGAAGAGIMALVFHLGKRKDHQYRPSTRMLPPPREAKVIDVTAIPVTRMLPRGPIITPPPAPRAPIRKTNGRAKKKVAAPIQQPPVSPAAVAKRCGGKGLNRQGYSVCSSRVLTGKPVYLRELQKKYRGKAATQ